MVLPAWLGIPSRVYIILIPTLDLGLDSYWEDTCWFTYLCDVDGYMLYRYCLVISLGYRRLVGVWRFMNGGEDFGNLEVGRMDERGEGREQRGEDGRWRI